MSKEIKVNIPAGLSAEDEAWAIRKQLTQKALSGSAKVKPKMIGNFIEEKPTETVIRVIRQNKEPIVKPIKCNVCGVEHFSNSPYKYFHNYGGVAKSVTVCSNECIDFVINHFGNRVARKRKDLHLNKFGFFSR